MVLLQVAGSHQPFPQRQPLVFLSASLWMQSRLCEPLYHWKLLTVQVGIGQPAGGVMERGRRGVAMVDVDKASRPVRIVWRAIVLE